MVVLSPCKRWVMCVQTLGSSNILSAPVLDEDQEYYGCVSVNDLLKDIMRGR